MKNRTVKMGFYCAGVVSYSNVKVSKETKDFIYLDDGEEKPWKFDKKTGRCLNDNTEFGCSRIIEPMI